MGVGAPDQYCRDIEAYLCRKNDGHLIRIVGPAFELVSRWAASGIPIAVARSGIDRYFERYYAKGPRRRPVRIEFCEADVLDAFDEWRRAVGLPRAAWAMPDVAVSGPAESGEELAPRRGSLPSHLDRVIARLTALRAGADPVLDERLAAVIRELDTRRGEAATLRGERRHAVVERLRVLDAELVAAVRHRCDSSTLARLAEEAEVELAPFKGRMTREAFDQSLRTALDRLIRERHRLPILAFE